MRHLTYPLGSLVALCGLVAACGGTPDGGTPAASSDREPPITATLVDDEGGAMPSGATAAPADAGARTRAGRYATAQQAAWLERALGDGVVSVDVGGSDATALEQAIGLGHAHQAAHDLPDSAPVLVRGADLRLAAVAADRLAAAGHGTVWLVLP